MELFKNKKAKKLNLGYQKQVIEILVNLSNKKTENLSKLEISKMKYYVKELIKTIDN